MILETVLSKVKSPKLVIFIFILVSAFGYIADFFGPEIRERFKDRQARIEISSPNKEVELNKKIVVEATIHSMGRDELKPGAFSIQVDPDFISLSSDKAVALDSITGSLPIKDIPDLKAIKLSDDHVKIVAKYESGKITVQSNELRIKIVKPVVIIHPHFDLTDIGRVNLSGEWTIELGGIPGKMVIRQGTDNNINGSFSVPDGIWTSGSVSGHKDGKTFRAQFSVAGKENTETIRVAGYFELSGQNGNQIELEGCAYHLQKSKETYNERGAEGVRCEADSVFYDYWKVLNAVRFYAKSPFERAE